MDAWDGLLYSLCVSAEDDIQPTEKRFEPIMNNQFGISISKCLLSTAYFTKNNLKHFSLLKHQKSTYMQPAKGGQVVKNA